jgi:hypothetical protein
VGDLDPGSPDDQRLAETAPNTRLSLCLALITWPLSPLIMAAVANAPSRRAYTARFSTDRGVARVVQRWGLG